MADRLAEELGWPPLSDEERERAAASLRRLTLHVVEGATPED